MPSSDYDRRLRAELAAEVGYFSATLDPADIERHRRMNAAADSAPSLEQISRKYAHLREEKRRSEIQTDGLGEVADLYE